MEIVTVVCVVVMTGAVVLVVVGVVVMADVGTGAITLCFSMKSSRVV